MGGNVFGDTLPIKKEYIKPTLVEFVKQLVEVFPQAEKHLNSFQILGSAGKKAESGDIDLALDSKVFKKLSDWGLDKSRVNELFIGFKSRARTATDDQLQVRAVLTAIAEKLEKSQTDIVPETEKVTVSTIFLEFPQIDLNGEKIPGHFIQIDINVGKIEWLKFSYYSARYDGNIKGLHRTQLVLTLFSNKGFSFSHNFGVKNRQTGEIVATDPETAIDVLNKAYKTSFSMGIINDYFKLIEYLRENLDSGELNKILDRYLQILDKTRVDIPEDLQEYWIENQDRLSLTGNFLPTSSKLLPFKQ